MVKVTTAVCSELALHCCRQHVHLCKLWFTNFCVCVSALYIIKCVGGKFENPKFKIEQRMSCEPARTRAYHPDLRWRMIYQRYVLNYSIRSISQNLCVDKTTVRRVLRLFDSTGSVDKRESQASRKKICITDQLHILELLLENPSMYLAELKRGLYSRGTDVHISTIYRFLQSSNFSKKKMRLIATQQSDELRGRYIAEVALYSPNMLIFVDETGCNRKDAIRRFGYSFRGKRCTAKRLLCRGQRVSAVAALSFERILDVKFVRGSLCGEGFSEFVELNLLPHLLPFNGSNPNSIVVLDNASVHYHTKVKELVTSVGALLVYLPPYSPDLNPIEEAFSAVKSFLKANEDIVQTYVDIENILLQAFGNISHEDCLGWYDDSGYVIKLKRLAT